MGADSFHKKLPNCFEKKGQSQDKQWENYHRSFLTAQDHSLFRWLQQSFASLVSEFQDFKQRIFVSCSHHMTVIYQLYAILALWKGLDLRKLLWIPPWWTHKTTLPLRSTFGSLFFFSFFWFLKKFLLFKCLFSFQKIEFFFIQKQNVHKLCVLFKFFSQASFFFQSAHCLKGKWRYLTWFVKKREKNVWIIPVASLELDWTVLYCKRMFSQKGIDLNKVCFAFETKGSETIGD